MPLYAKKDRTIHHIHIPGCAGNSISKALRDNGWHIISLPIPQMFESGFNFKKEKDESGVWKARHTKHEHNCVWKSWIEGAGINLDFQFAVVRNPYTKLNSCLKKIKNVNELKFVEDFDVNKINIIDSNFLIELISHAGVFPNNQHNKFLPQSEFLDNGINVYKIESGLKNLLEDLVSAEILKEDQKLEVLNSSPANFKIDIPWSVPKYEIAHSLFTGFYRKDFNNLNYPIMQILGTSNRE
jgi:hypothetical protein